MFEPTARMRARSRARAKPKKTPKIDARRRDSTIRDVRAEETRDETAMTRVSPRGRRGKHIVYDAPPRNRAERRQRREEQRDLAQARNLKWGSLCRAGKTRRIRFGSKAVCRNLRDVRDLARINCRIAHDRELRAVNSWRLKLEQLAQLDRCIGFGPSDRLPASNKRVRVKTAVSIARQVRRALDRSNWYSYSITMIHDDWLTSEWSTVLDLGDIRSRVDEVMARANLHWFGMIEIDLFNNWKGAHGRMVTPHVHLIAWSRIKRSAKQVLASLDGSLLRSEIGAPVIVVKPIRYPGDLMHSGYYIAKPNYKVKSLGKKDAISGRKRTYSIENSVRPSYTLRLAEILSYLEISDLMLAHRRGKGVRASVLRSIRDRGAAAAETRATSSGIREMWEALMPNGRRERSKVRIRE